MKLLTTSLISLVLSVSVLAHAVATDFVPVIPYPNFPAPNIELKGSQAEFLFKIINKFENVPQFGGVVDCASGNCTAQLEYVSCAKNFEPMMIDPGQLTEPFLTCSHLTPSMHQPNLTDDETSGGVSELRRLLIGVTGKLYTYPDSQANLISVRKITCKASNLGRPMNNLATEEVYSCEIQIRE